MESGQAFVTKSANCSLTNQEEWDRGKHKGGTTFQWNAAGGRDKTRNPKS